MTTNPLAELSVWLEEMRHAWAERGVNVLEREAKTIWPWLGTDGKSTNPRVFIGSVEACGRDVLVESEFIALIVLGEISVEHSKILIENAVDQVAGR